MITPTSRVVWVVLVVLAAAPITAFPGSAFAGNDPPYFLILPAPVTIGATSPEGAVAGLTAAAVDPDNDPLTFTWTGPFGTIVQTGTFSSVGYLFPPGTYLVTVTVSDGNSSISASADVTVEGINTAPGSGGAVTVSPVNDTTMIRNWSRIERPVRVTFPSVTGPGLTWLQVRTDLAPPLPAGLQAGIPAYYYDLRTTAGYTGPVTVCLDTRGHLYARPDQIQLYQQSGSGWIPLASTVTPGSTICAAAPAVGVFAVFYPKVPGMATATIAGNGVWPGSIDGPGGNPADDFVEGAQATSVSTFPRFGALDGVRRRLYYSDGLEFIRQIDLATGIVTTVAGTGYIVGGFDGPGGDPRDDIVEGGDALTTTVGDPTGLALDEGGNVYFTTGCGVRKLDIAAHRLYTVAGSLDPATGDFQCGYSGDGGPATSATLFPNAGKSAFDAAGNLFIPDSGNNRVRRVDASSGIITTVAGNGLSDFFVPGHPLQVAVGAPHTLAFDRQGHLLVNSNWSDIVRISPGADGLVDGDPSETLTRIAGNDALFQNEWLSPLWGDGLAALSAIVPASDLLVAPDGALIVTTWEYGGSIRRIAPGADGVVTGEADETIARIAGAPSWTTEGTFIGFFNGDRLATEVTLAFPSASVLDENGDILVFDGNNMRIRRIPYLAQPPLSNHPPTANAGPDQAAIATGPSGAAVTLTGTGFDPDGDLLSFSWTGPCGTASTAQATFTCPIGTSVMTLVVGDGRATSAPDTVTVTVLTEPTADLTVGVTTDPASPATVSIGQTETLTIVVTNNGPDAASDARFSGLESLTTLTARGWPTFESLSVESTQGTCGLPAAAGAKVTCRLGGLASGASATITVRAVPGADAFTNYSGGVVGSGSQVAGVGFQVRADSSEIDPNGRDNLVSAGFTVQLASPTPSPADLSISATASPAPPSAVAPGQLVTVEAVVTNNGPNPATGVRFSGFKELTGQLAGWPAFEALSVSSTQGTCHLPDAPGLPVLCSLGSLATGASATITFRAAPSAIAFQASVIGAGQSSMNAVGVGVSSDVRASETDPDGRNNLARTGFTVNCVPNAQATSDVALTALVAPAHVVVGQQVTITATVVNNGPDSAPLSRLIGFGELTGLTSSGWPAFDAVSAVSSRGTCAVSSVPGDRVRCQFGTLAPGESAIVTVTAVPTDALVLSSRNSGTTGPGGLGSNSGSVGVEVTATAGSSATDPVKNNLARAGFRVDSATAAPSPSQGVPTPTGTDVVVQPTDPAGVPQPITLTFAGVAQAGISSAVPLGAGPALPANFKVDGAPYGIATTAAFTPPVSVCFDGSFTSSSAILHFDETDPACDPNQPSTCWVALPNARLLPEGAGPYSRICADTSSFSPFAVADLIAPPFAADAGASQTVEATSSAGAAVALDGSVVGPGSGVLEFIWSGSCGMALGAGVSVTCPMGANTMTLTVVDQAGLTASANVDITVRDSTPPQITISSPVEGATYVLNAVVVAGYACADGASLVSSCTGSVANGSQIDTSTVGTRTFTVTSTDAAGNSVTVTRSYTVSFASGGTCLTNAGHQILSPIAADGSSVFFQGLPIPARFRVCDVNGRSISTPGLVASFRIVQTTFGGVSKSANLAVPSWISPAVFYWDPWLKEWELLIDTRKFVKKTSYAFRITLDDASVIDFRFGVK